VRWGTVGRLVERAMPISPISPSPGHRAQPIQSRLGTSTIKSFDAAARLNVDHNCGASVPVDRYHRCTGVLRGFGFDGYRGVL
jgi:hypothetical protein